MDWQFVDVDEDVKGEIVRAILALDRGDRENAQDALFALAEMIEHTPVLPSVDYWVEMATHCKEWADNQRRRGKATGSERLN